MKVVLFVGTLQAGGLERFVTRISIEAKAQFLFEPVVVCLISAKGIFLSELQAAGVPVYQAPALWYRSPMGLLKLSGLLKKIGPDLVHSQVNFSILQQHLACFIGGIRFTITERNCYERKGLALFRRRLQYGWLRAFGVSYSANSIRVARHLAEMLNVSVDRFAVIPNGLKVLGEGASHHAGSITIGYIARMAHHKGHLFFIEVLRELILVRNLRCNAVLIGDGPLRTEIHELVLRFGLEKHVELTGVVSDVERRILSFDIVSLLSEYEGMPNVVIEGMAAGKPVIVTDVGNVSELVNSDAGIILTNRDVTAAADAFETLINDPMKRLSMGNAGKERIRLQFSLENSLERLVSYYKETVI